MPYSLTVEDKIWNYLVGWSELGLPLDSVYEHFLETVPAGTVARVASAALGKAVTISIKEAETAREVCLPVSGLAKAA